MQDGDITVPTEHLGRFCNSSPIDAVHQALRTVSSADADNAMDARVRKRIIKICRTFAVISGQITVPHGTGRKNDRLQPKCLHTGHGRLQAPFWNRAGRRDQRDTRACTQRFWYNHGSSPLLVQNGYDFSGTCFPPPEGKAAANGNMCKNCVNCIQKHRKRTLCPLSARTLRAKNAALRPSCHSV